MWESGYRLDLIQSTFFVNEIDTIHVFGIFHKEMHQTQFWSVEFSDCTLVHCLYWRTSYSRFRKNLALCSIVSLSSHSLCSHLLWTIIIIGRSDVTWFAKAFSFVGDNLLEWKNLATFLGALEHQVHLNFLKNLVLWVHDSHIMASRTFKFALSGSSFSRSGCEIIITF